MAPEEVPQLLQGVFPGGQLPVQALGLDVDVVKAVFLAQGQVLQHGVVLAEAVAAFVKSDFHGSFSLSFLNRSIIVYPAVGFSNCAGTPSRFRLGVPQRKEVCKRDFPSYLPKSSL